MAFTIAGGKRWILQENRDLTIARLADYMGYAPLILKVLRRHALSYIRDLTPNPLLDRNRRFLGRHSNDRCFILGSGHSIMTHDLSVLRNEIVMTQNNFHVHPLIASIRPKYHVVVPKYQPASYDATWRQWYAQMATALPGDTIFFVGAESRPIIESIPKMRERAFYLHQGYHCAFRKTAPIRLDKTIMAVPTVLTECLAIALYMGFREVNLVGFDLDQLFRIHDRSTVRFYGHSLVTETAYEAAAEQRTGASGIDWVNMWIIWRQCGMLKVRADAMGIKIVNATAGGLLNMFPRVPFETVTSRNERSDQIGV